jgi:3-oxoacyl-[acyl-carrier protein] reductase
MRLDNKIAIVTGARRGIGRAIALAMSQEGAKVVVSDIDLEDCQKVVHNIEQSGGKGLAVECDVSSRDAVEGLVKQTVETFGKLDILVNNAARVTFKSFLRLNEAEWDDVLSANLKGQFLCAQAAAKAMLKNRSGRIINIASISSGLGGGLPLMSNYTASKGGVIGLTKALAQELAPYDINVTAICPGAIDTGLLPPEMERRLIARIPKGRLGKPEEVARLAVFLASEDSEYITGSAIVIDGGWLSA